MPGLLIIFSVDLAKDPVLFDKFRLTCVLVKMNLLFKNCGGWYSLQQHIH
jgi:hypothetical protein